MKIIKPAIVFLLAGITFGSCNQPVKTIRFKLLKAAEFNARSFAVGNGQPPDSLKRVHDSCMGFVFDANAILAGRKDSLFVGTIVNRQSLKVVNTINELGLTQAQLMSRFNVITKPCYEEKVLHFPLKTLLSKGFIIQVPNTTQSLNNEINNAIAASENAELETGSWIYLDMNEALKNVPDTAQTAAALHYKKNLLDSSNMVLTAMESIMNVSFMIHSTAVISASLQKLLQTKPTITLPNSQFTARLFYINDHQFQLLVNGFFPMTGQFMGTEVR